MPATNSRIEAVAVAEVLRRGAAGGSFSRPGMAGFQDGGAYTRLMKPVGFAPSYRFHARPRGSFARSTMTKTASRLIA